MQAVRFKAAQAGSAWLDCGDLAKLCEGAGLTTVQAEVVRLASRKYTHAEVADSLALPVGVVRSIAVRAEIRLRKTQSWLWGALYREIRMWQECRRNTFNPKPKAALFGKRPGGFDPVRFAARPHGELPEDLIEERGRLLRTLPLLLSRRGEDARAP